jgi:hypothetical protein
LLNMMMMSRRRRAPVGELGFRHFSRSAIVECMIKSSPLGMPIPN